MQKHASLTNWKLIAVLLFTAAMIYSFSVKADDSIESQPEVVEMLEEIKSEAPTAKDVTSIPVQKLPAEPESEVEKIVIEIPKQCLETCFQNITDAENKPAWYKNAWGKVVELWESSDGEVAAELGNDGEVPKQEDG